MFLHYFNLYFPLRFSQETNLIKRFFKSPKIKEFQNKLYILNSLKIYPECSKIYYDMKIEHVKLLTEGKSKFYINSDKKKTKHCSDYS